MLGVWGVIIYLKKKIFILYKWFFFTNLQAKHLQDQVHVLG